MPPSARDHQALAELARARGLPPPPDPPDERECCGRGCDPCIWDYYERALRRWCAREGVGAPEP